ncbi:MAG: hypothetical protein ACI9XZ_003458 [Alphaproteobacteria bacterium]|jgi:hypothetical protein
MLMRRPSSASEKPVHRTSTAIADRSKPAAEPSIPDVDCQAVQILSRYDET